MSYLLWHWTSLTCEGRVATALSLYSGSDLEDDADMELDEEPPLPLVEGVWSGGGAACIPYTCIHGTND